MQCPLCETDMVRGQARLQSSQGDNLLFNAWMTSTGCWFVSKGDRDWLVVPKQEAKEAFRCLTCGTTIILRGK